MRRPSAKALQLRVAGKELKAGAFKDAWFYAEQWGKVASGAQQTARSDGDELVIDLQPGEAPAITFGVGFALNDRAALTFSYQQTHVFTAYANGQAIPGSPYSFGTFNFGLGYQISQSTRLNLSVGIGTGPNTPAAKVLLEVPYKFSL